jgi:hypothetical protein
MYEFIFSLQCAIYIRWVNCRAFFGHCMSQDCNVPAVEKIQNSILHVPLFCSKLIDAIPQKIGFRTAKLMARFRQSIDARPATRLTFAISRLQFVEPIQYRDFSVVILIKQEMGGWHFWYSYLYQFCYFASTPDRFAAMDDRSRWYLNGSVGRSPSKSIKRASAS